jgi:bacteriorhodopsin
MYFGMQSDYTIGDVGAKSVVKTSSREKIEWL